MTVADQTDPKLPEFIRVMDEIENLLQGLDTEFATSIVISVMAEIIMANVPNRDSALIDDLVERVSEHLRLACRTIHEATLN